MWRRYMGHVVTVVGGVRMTPKASDQAGVVYAPVGRQEQERALAFLDANVFETPTWMLDAEILRRIQPTGAVDGIRRAQVAVLDDLLDPMRLGRLVEAEAVDSPAGGAAPYPLAAFMDDLREDVWAELDARRPAVDVYRRNLQRGYVERLASLLTEDERAPPRPRPQSGRRREPVRRAGRGSGRAPAGPRRRPCRGGADPRRGDARPPPRRRRARGRGVRPAGRGGRGVTEFPVLCRLTYRPAQRKAFAAGSLRERWAGRYPELFDDRDVRNARSRPEKHFYGWLAAVALYESTGWRSLVEKYQFAHPRKQAVLRRLGADALVDFFATQREAFGALQAPDLLHNPGGAGYALCEVKGPNDRLRPEQAAYFRALSEAAGRPVFTVLVHPTPF